MNSIPAMVDMRRSASDKQDTMLCAPCDYPYGLSISLDNESLNKLNVDFDSIEIGGIYHLFVLAKVTAKSRNESDGSGTSERCELQITHMAGESEDKENEEAESITSKMYKKK